jgi:hypothetical protein
MPSSWPGRETGVEGEACLPQDEPPALLRYEVVFEVINAKGPEFVLELDKDGWLNIESAFVEKTPDVSPFNVYIRSLGCTDGTFEYRSRAGKPIVRLNGFELLMKSAFETDTSISLSVPKAAIALFIGDTKIDLGRGGASCSIFNDRISDIRIASRLGSSNASLTGSITDMAKKAQLLCDLEIDADMVDISNSMGLVPEDTGRIAGRISARHDYDNPELGFSLKYSAARSWGWTSKGGSRLYHDRPGGEHQKALCSYASVPLIPRESSTCGRPSLQDSSKDSRKKTPSPMISP